MEEEKIIKINKKITMDIKKLCLDEKLNLLIQMNKLYNSEKREVDQKLKKRTESQFFEKTFKIKKDLYKKEFKITEPLKSQNVVQLENFKQILKNRKDINFLKIPLLLKEFNFPEYKKLITELCLSIGEIDDIFEQLTKILTNLYINKKNDLHDKTLDLIISVLENNIENLEVKNLGQKFDDFIMNIPIVNNKLVHLCFKISQMENCDSKALAFLSVILEDKKDAVFYAVKSGKSEILKKIDTFFKNDKIYGELIIPTAKKNFEDYLVELEEKRKSGEILEKSEEDFKKIVLPLLMCTLKENSLLHDILRNYGKLPEKEANFLETKIAKLVEKTIKKHVEIEQILDLLTDEILKDEGEIKKYNNIFKNIIKIFKSESSIKKKLMEVLKIKFEKDKRTFLHIFSEIDNSLILEIILEKYKTNQNLKKINISNIIKTWKIEPTDIIFNLAFSEFQKQDYSICEKFFKEFYELYKNIIDRKITVEKIIKNIDKEIPLLIIHINFIFANDNFKEQKSIDPFIEIFKIGIEKKLYDEKFFWERLLMFCAFDRIIAQETIEILLPEKYKRRFYDQLSRYV